MNVVQSALVPVTDAGASTSIGTNAQPVTIPSAVLQPSFAGNGRLEIGFGHPATDDSADAVAVLADRRLVVAGVAGDDVAIVRLLADGSPDLNFGSGGRVVTDISGVDQARALAVQQDGKIVVAGTTDDGTNLALLRYTVDGMLDVGFGDNGKVLRSIAASTTAEGFTQVLVQPDGQIVAAGFSGNTYLVERYTAQGVLDNSFSLDGREQAYFSGTLRSEIQAMALQDDGKLLVAGRVRISSDKYDFAVARYLSDGTLDPHFNGTGLWVANQKADDSLSDIQVQRDGKIVAAGRAGSSSRSGDGVLIRLNADGSLDSSFDGDGSISFHLGSDDRFETLDILANGQILAAGAADDEALVARFNPNGSLDVGFGTNGALTTEFGESWSSIHDSALTPQGRWIGVGQSYNFDTTPDGYEFGILQLGASLPTQHARAYLGSKRPSGSPPEFISHQIPADAFYDPDGDVLVYSASLPDGSPLPEWLSFDAATRTLSGKPAVSDFGSHRILITASDGLAQLSEEVLLQVDTDFIDGVQSIDDRLNIGSALGTPRLVSYSFMTTNSAATKSVETNTFAPMTEAERAAVREILGKYAAVSGLTFVEIDESTGQTGILRYGTYDDSGVSTSGYARGNADGSDIWMNRSYIASHGTVAAGSRPYGTMTHETGHALGLKHPGIDPGDSPPFVDKDYGLEDSRTNSIMSYSYREDAVVDIVWEGNSGSYIQIYPSTPMSWDVAAIQQMYGVNTRHRDGDDVYTFDPAVPFFSNLWDAGGQDTVDISLYVHDSVISLVPGTFSSLHTRATQANARDYWGERNLSISYNAIIEHAIGGSGNDSLVGNDAANHLQGKAGNDTLNGGAGDDTLDGGEGDDTVVFSGPRSSYIAQWGNDSTLRFSSSGQGADQIIGIETFKFDDAVYSLAEILASVIIDDGIDDPTVGSVTITGSAIEAGLLRSLNNLSDPDGPLTLNYAWQIAPAGAGSNSADWSALPGANQSQLNLSPSQDQIGQVVRVSVTATDPAGRVTIFLSDATAPIENVNDAPTWSNVTLDGGASVGGRLTLNTAGLTDADGLGPLSIQWRRDGVDILGQAGSSYEIVTEDAGRKISAFIRFTDGFDANESFHTPSVTVEDPNQPALQTDPSVAEAANLYFVNAIRADPTGWARKLGVTLASGEGSVRSPLVFNESLMTAASSHSLQMYEADVLAHSGNGFGTVSGRAEAAGYAPNSYLGENIYMESAGYDALAEIGTRTVVAWFESSGHRANLLDKYYTEFGVSFAYASPEQDGDSRYATQTFGQAWRTSKTYLSGFIFQDADADAFYDAGEGVNQVTLVVTTTGPNPSSIVVPVSATGYWRTEAQAGTYSVQVQSGQKIHQLDDVVVDAANRSIDFNTETQSFQLDFKATSTSTPGLLAVPDSFTVLEDGTSDALDLLSNDLDESGATLSLASIEGITLTPGSAQTVAVTQGAVKVGASGSLTFTPAPNYHGPVSFSYAVTNGTGATASGTVTGTVVPSEDEAVGTLVVSGNPELGRSIAASLSGASDPDGPITRIDYRWQQNTGTTESPVWSDMGSASAASLSIEDHESWLGRQVRALATTTDSLGGTTEFASNAVTIVEASTPPTGSAGRSSRSLVFGQVIDTWIDVNNPNTAYGGAASLDIDLSSSNAPKEQTLIQFADLFGTEKGQIRPDDTIISASLRLASEGYSGNGLLAYRMLQAWSDAVTWASLGNGIQTDGVEAISTPDATRGAYEAWTDLSVDITASLQAWQAAPASNFGWMITSTDSEGGRFGASEGGSGPILEVSVQRVAALVSVTAADPFAFEGTSTGAFTVSRTSTVGDLIVPYVIRGTATASHDFAPLSGNLVIPDGRASATLNVIPLEDDVAEGPETVTIEIVGSPAIETDLAEATVTIRDRFSAQGGEIVPLDQTFELHSLPGARHTIYLDFLGSNRAWGRWNDGQPINTPIFDTDGDPSTFSNAERILIQRTWASMAEDFRPFEINVTTAPPLDGQLVKTDATDLEWGIRAIFGKPSNWDPGATGKAVLNSFTANIETPAWIQTTSKHMAVFASHEVGHALGLNHDGRGSTEYYEGHGSGETSWGPLMGGALAGQISQWSDGNYPNATNREDDLLILSTRNGFGYRVDDHADALSSATPLVRLGRAPGIQTSEGVIERNTDVDWFSFVLGEGAFEFMVEPLLDFANLDVRLALYDGDEVLLGSANPVNQLSASLTSTVSAGTYYLRVEGDGNPDPGSDGYDDYGSLGFYTVRVAPAATTLSFQQGVNGYSSTQDTYIGRDFSSAKGTESSLMIDGSYSSYPASALIRFDDIFGDDAGAIPDDALIQSSSLEVKLTRSGEAFTVHRMLRDWSESDTYGSLADGVAADDQEATSEVVTRFDEGAPGWYSLDVTSAIEAWLADPAANFGLLLQPVAGTTIRNEFASSESADPPRLTIRYLLAEEQAQTGGLLGSIVGWKDPSPLDAVKLTLVTATPANGRNSTSDLSGEFTFDALDPGPYTLLAERDANDSLAAITSADAMAVLKLALGRNPNPDPDGPGPLQPAAISPYQWVAADINADGQVDRADAQAILKIAQGSATGSDALPEWVFVDETAVLSSVNASRVELPDLGPLVAAGTAQSVNLIGILRGDVDGSWTPLNV
jgi:uncharacterized delta-60 repeat protein